MPISAATGTLIVVFVIVAALAIYLTVIAYSLYRVSFTLGTILIGVRAIANQTEPVANVVAGIADNVTGIEHALADLVEPSQAPRRRVGAGRR